MVTFPEDSLFATVAVDQPVDGTYTYRVPAEMRRDVRAGSRVTVPLGRGNRMIAGTVMGVSEKGPEMVEEVAAEGTISGETESLFEGDDLGVAVTPEREGGMKAILEVHRECGGGAGGSAGVGEVDQHVLLRANWHDAGDDGAGGGEAGVAVADECAMGWRVVKGEWRGCWMG